MTLALYGKSRGRKAVLILAAFLAVAIAVLGGTTLPQQSGRVGAAADPTITAKDHEGERSNGTYTNGNITTYTEGDFIDFRFTLTGDASTSGTLEVRFTGDDGTCLFFDPYFLLGTIQTVSGASPTVGTLGVPVAQGFGTSGGEWVQSLNVSFVGAGEAIVNYRLQLSQEAGQCNGSSQHSRLNPAGGAISQTGQQNVPIPANQIIELPDITVIKKIDRNGDGTFEATATAGEYCFTLDGGNCTPTDANGQVVFTNVEPDGAHAITETQLITTLGTYQFASGSGTNCTFTGSTATATVAAGTTPTNATCTFNNNSLPDLTVSKSAVAPAGGFQVGVPFKWRWVVTNGGPTSVSFPSGSVVLADTLPAGATYANPAITAGTSTNLICTLPTATTLSCTAGPAAYVLAAGASVTVTVDATPAAAGTLDNANQVCVDPGNVVPESNDTNNTCQATATVGPDPTIQKVANTNPGATTTTTAAWTITVNNNGTNAIAQTVKLTEDAGATFGTPSFTAGGSCGAQSGTEIICTLPAGSVMTMPVTKTVTATCEGGPATNSVTLSVLRGAAYVQVGSVSNVAVTVPGDPGLCIRTVTVCKVITNNNDGVADNASFSFTTTAPGPANLSTPLAAEGGSVVCATPFNLQANQTTTITETVPSGWLTPTYTVGAGPSTSGNSAVVPASSANVTVTFTNVKDSRVIKVCKVIADNNDGANDSRAFTFDPSNGPDLTTPSITEGAAVVDASCRTFIAPVDAAATVLEDLPPGWLTPTITGANETSGVTATIPAGTADSTVTFTNTRASRTLQVCKIVEDNNDELSGQGGTFVFSLSGSTNSVPGVPATETQGEQCGATVIIPTTAISVSEGALPSGFTNANGYPKYQVDGGTVTQGGTANVAEGSANVKVTFINRAPTGTLTINKTLIPSGDAGRFDLDRDGGTHEATNVGNNGTTGAMTVSAGSHTVAEFGGTTPATNLTDYDTTVTCTGDTGPQSTTSRSVTVAEGANVVCTFTNTRKPKLTVVKDLYPEDDGGRFDLINGASTYAGPGGGGFGDGGSTGSQYAAIGPNAFGETAHSGTSISDYVTSASCTGGTGFTFSSATATGSITLAAGDDITCTVTNNRKARITIAKVTDPASDQQDFTFSASGPNAYSDGATLDTDGVSADPSSKTLSGLVPGSYTVTETNIPAGWALTNIACSGATVQYGGTSNAFVPGQSSVVITAEAGNDVTCTFTNTKQARIIIEKDTVPASDTTTAFTFDPSWSDTNFTLESDQSHTSPYLAPGTYSIVENALTGWDLTSATCDVGETIEDITLGAGETVTCTFVNTQRGRIIVDKVTDPAGSPQSFNFHIDNGPSDLNLDFSLTDTATPFDTGLIKPTTPGSTYAVSEDVPSAWLQGTVTCDGPVGEPSPASAVVVAPGETVTCTFNNAIKRGSITIEKQTSPDGASGTFSFTTTGAFVTEFSPTLSDGQSAVRTNLYPGTFSITETDPGVSWHLQSIVCTNQNQEAQGSTNLETRSVSITLDPAEDITCVFTNEQHGSITVIKDAVPNDGQDFAFTLTGQAGATLDDDADGTNSNTKTWSNLAAGSFTLAETLGVQGWTLTDISCQTADTSDAISRNIAAGTAAITLDPGESVTCTYTNKKDATLTIVKDAQPNGPQDFGFTTSGAGLSNFSLDDDADVALSNTKVFTISGSDFGQKTITESAVAGWSLTDITCDEGSDAGATATVTVDPGDTITCTFTNKQDATLTIIKDADPNNAQDFAFTTSGSQLAGFDLDDDDDGTLSNTKVFTISGTGFGEKSVTETGVAGWALTNINCTEGSVLGSTATVQVDPGDAITCTFTNKQDATVTIVKDAIPDSGQDFSFTVSGGGLTNFVLDDDGAAGSATPNSTTFTIPAANFGQKTITEANTTGWALTGIVCSEGTTDGSSATFTVDAGDAIRCTFTNKQDATLTIVKDAQPNSAQDFGFETTGLVTTNFSLDDDADGTLPSSRQFTISGDNFGTKTVTETGTTGWSLTDISCTKGSDAGATATVDIQPGDSVTCTFTNKQDATVTVIKNAIPDGPQDFAFTTAGAGLSGFSLDDDDNADLPNTKQFTISGSDFGSKTVTETAMTGWDLTGLICSEGSITGAQATLQVDPGDTITCTFTNTQRGSITIIKDVVPNDAAADFDFTIDGAGSGNDSNRSLTDISEADGAQPESNLLPGGYTVSEGGHAGYSTTVSCSNNATGTDSASFTLNPGENVTCTFVNSRLASLTIAKDAVPNSAQDFGFTTSGTGLSAFSLDDDADATLSNTTTFSNLSITPGSNVYDVTETAVTGWDLTNIVCPDADVVFGEPAAFAPGDRTAHIILHPGDNITCTFTNTQRGTIIVEKQTIPDGAAGSFTFTGNAAGIISDDGTITVTDLVPGTYTSEETVPEGWDLTSVTCDDRESETPSGIDLDRVARFRVDPGETVRCVFTNTQRGSITVIKDAIPDSADDFNFTLTGQTEVTLDDDGDAANSNTHTWTNLAPGAYTLEETGIPITGWDLTDLTCVSNQATPVFGFTREGGKAFLSVDPGEQITCTYENTARGRIIVDKVTLPAGATQGFAFTLTGGNSNLDQAFNLADGTAPHNSGLILPGTGYAVAETAVAGWDLTSATCSDGSPVSNINLGAGEVVTCTFTNTQRGNIQVVKIDQTSAAIPGRPSAWNFLITGPNGFSENRTIPLGGGDAALITNVPLGNGYSVVETEAIAGSCPVPNATPTYRTTGPGGAQNLVTPGSTITFTFTNRECELVASTGNLLINKYNDLNGNHVQDAGEGGISGWEMTITGPQFPGGTVVKTDTNGAIILPGIFTGTYTITEETRTTHTAIGVVTNDNAPVFTAGGTTTSVVLDYSDEDVVSFYNQPRSSIRVTKTQVFNGDASPGSGWTFTLTGCGITPRSATTSSSGVVVFTNLQPAGPNCSYIVTESVSRGWTVSPAIAQAAAPAAGQEVVLNFVNSRTEIICIDCNPTPTPTATATPTNTPTATPTRTPTQAPAQNTRGPVELETPRPTPIAPNTGDGFGGGIASINTAIILAAMIALGAGLLVTGTTRKRNR